MQKPSTKRAKIGDVIEIPTSKGCAYAQYTHEHKGAPIIGSLLRVLPGFHSSRPQSYSELIGEREQFSIFYPLQSSLRRNIFCIVGNEKVPEWATPFPIFRNGTPDRSGVIQSWWLWDGEKEWKVGSLSPEMRSFPILQIVNDTGLIQLIEMGWKAEDRV